MWKIYLKQIRYQLKENRFFSVIYILGTALSITMVMMILITYHLKTGNIGVEDRRDRMAFINSAHCIDTDSWAIAREKGRFNKVNIMNSGSLSLTVFRTCIAGLKIPEAVSLVCRGGEMVQNKSTNLNEMYTALYTDDAFWRMFAFRFVAGKPFDRAEVEGRTGKVVITESVARRLYGTTEVVGYPISIGWQPFQVCGVIKDVPTYSLEAFADIYMPYTAQPLMLKDWDKYKMVGNIKAYFLLKDKNDLPALRRELDHHVQRYNAGSPTRKLEIAGQPDTILEASLRNNTWPQAPDVLQMVGLYTAIVLILLIVPALNISGLIVSRMKQRQEEIGIRKAFGASSGALIGQLMMENMMQMLVGGVVGLLMSVGLFQLFNEVLLGVSGSDSIAFWHLVSPVTVAYVIGACLLLNLFSALIPAWRATRMKIVDALKK